MVEELNKFIDNIQISIIEANALKSNDLQVIANMLEAEIDPKDPPEVNYPSFLLGVLGAILGGIPGLGKTAKEAFEVTKMVIELIAESIELASELGEHEDAPGENSFKLNLGNLYDDLNYHYEKQKRYMKKAQELITSDWGSLKAARDIITSKKEANLLFTNTSLIKKAYRVQVLRILLPLKFGIIHIHEDEYNFNGQEKYLKNKLDATIFKNRIFSKELEHAVYKVPLQGVSLFVKNQVFKLNSIGELEEIIQYFPSKGLMEWLTGERNDQYGINKAALIQGKMGWEGIETRKGIGKSHGIKVGLYIGDNHRGLTIPAAQDPIEDLSSWKPNKIDTEMT
jgi:hypothetical protein